MMPEIVDPSIARIEFMNSKIPLKEFAQAILDSFSHM